MKLNLVRTLVVSTTLLTSIAHGATLFWSGNGSTLGGAGSWDTTAAHWGTAVGGPFTTVWNNANSDTAQIGDSSETLSATQTVTVSAPLTINGSLSFGSVGGTAGYAMAGTSTVTFASGSTLSVASGVTRSIGCPYAGVITKPELDRRRLTMRAGTSPNLFSQQAPLISLHSIVLEAAQMWRTF